MKLRRTMIVTIMIAATILLSLSGGAANPTTTTTDLCSDCEWDCSIESYNGYNNCIEENGDTPTNQTTCYNAWGVNYYNACISTFCNPLGCSIKRKIPRGLPGGT